MHWTGWIVITLAVLTGGWMAFDGSRALVVGDYVTASSGAYAGQLGPWANLAQSAGIPPRSTVMKCIVAGYGLATLIVAICFALRQPWAWWGMLAVAVLGLWYLPMGTITGVVLLVLLFLRRPAR